MFRLEHLGVIEVSGEDNIRFLNGQLSNDLTQLSPTTARLAAFCSAKGRMQASFVVVQRDSGAVLLVCSADLLAPTLKRLSMFVMRAKVKLRDASGDYAIFGLLGQSTLSADGAATLPWSATSIAHAAADAAEPAEAGEGGEATGIVAVPRASVVQLYPALGLARQLWIAPRDASAPGAPDASASVSDWLVSEVLSGVATVSAALAEAFVPQMLNYESVGGVSFRKGCYPGQEVVARSQFRGTLKRRAYIVQASLVYTNTSTSTSAITSTSASTDTDTGAGTGTGTETVTSPFAGQELFSSQDPTQPCGLVVQAARSASGPWVAIVSMQTSVAEEGVVHLGAADGPVMILQNLPYALLENI